MSFNMLINCITSSCFLIGSCLLCLKVYPFSMQVIDQDEPRQGIIGLLGEEDAPEESY